MSPKGESSTTSALDPVNTIAHTNGATTNDILESLRLIEDLKFFLATAPANWHENQVIRRYYLNHDEGFVLCVFWNNLYFITGTDIVRCIVYKFEHFGRKIVDRKKFEEGVFSDLRNLKIGTDAILEAPRSEFLEFLFKNSCLRTQKKQKVFFWFNVPHDKLTADALDRDLKKEKMGQKATTVAVRDPALLFSYDEDKPFLYQLEEHLKAQTAKYKKDPPSPSADTAVTTTLGAASSTFPPETTNLSMPSMLHHQIPSERSYGTSNGQNMTKTYHNTHSLIKDPTSELKSNNPENYEFLNQETPAQFKQSDEDEDDFPLDYFQNPTNNDDYIQFDPNFQYSIYPSGIPDENKAIDFVVDPSVLFNGSTTPTTKLVFNEEYLIEQTVPINAPLPQAIEPGGPMFMQPPPTASLVGPQLAYHPPPSATNYSYYFPYPSDYSQYPVSAKYQTAFPKFNPLLQQSQVQQTNFPQDSHVKNEYDQLLKNLQRKFHPQDLNGQRAEQSHFQYGQEQDVWPMAVPVTPMYAGAPTNGVYPPHGVDPYMSVPVNQPYLVYDGDFHHNSYMVTSPITKYVPQLTNAGFRSGQTGMQQQLGSGHKKNRIPQSSQSGSQLLTVPGNTAKRARTVNNGVNERGAISKKSQGTSSMGNVEKKSAVLEEVVQSKITKNRILASTTTTNENNHDLMIATPDSSASDSKLK